MKSSPTPQSTAIVRNSLTWGAAMIASPVVMVILDGFDRHTPTSVALCTAMVIMLIYAVSNSLLVKSIAEIDASHKSVGASTAATDSTESNSGS